MRSSILFLKFYFISSAFTLFKELTIETINMFKINKKTCVHDVNKHCKHHHA